MWNRKSNLNKNMRFNIYITLIICTSLFVEMCQGAPLKEKAFLDAQTIVDGWEANYCHIDSFKLRYTRILVDEKGQNQIGNKHDPFFQYERIQDGTRFLVRTVCSPQGLDNATNYSINSFDGSIFREYSRNVRNGRGDDRGTIYQGLPDWGDNRLNDLETFLGSLPYLSLDKFTSREEPQWKVNLEQQYPLGIPIFLDEYYNALEAEVVVVHPHLESVAGEPCHVLEYMYSSSSIKYWFAHDKGMLPMKKKSFSAKHGRKNETTKEVKEIASVKTDMGILWYPRVITQERVEEESNYSYTTEVTIEEFIPHFKAPAETFSYVFPNGTHVIDRIAHIGYIVEEEPKDQNEK